MYKTVELKVSGKLLRGCVRAPEGRGPFPTVCFFHGLTVDKVGQMRLHELFARQCAANGLACVRFDFYGCGESDGDFSEMLASDEIEQAIAISGWAREQDFTDPEALFICGHSLGGAIAGAIAPLVRPRAAVLWSPAPNIYFIAGHRCRTMKGPTAKGFDIDGLEISRDFLTDARRINFVERAMGYDGKTLIVHGTADDVTPVEIVGLYEDVYGKRLTSVLLQGADHQFTSLPWKQKLYDASIGFMKEILSGA